MNLAELLVDISALKRTACLLAGTSEPVIKAIEIDRKAAHELVDRIRYTTDAQSYGAVRLEIVRDGDYDQITVAGVPIRWRNTDPA